MRFVALFYLMGQNVVFMRLSLNSLMAPGIFFAAEATLTKQRKQNLQERIV
jgi:hypothetical protein